jgi:hypothetical protein
MAEQGNVAKGDTPKRHILLNAFDMSTVGHLSPGQWKVSSIIREASLKLTVIQESGRQIRNKAKAELLDRPRQAS